MDLSRPPLVVGFALSEQRKAIVADALASASAVVYLTELDETARAEALRNAGALLTFNPFKELRPSEAKLLNGARLIQFMIGGVDFIPLSELPEGVPVATNGGGYAESMAEHALAMALAAAKRLVLEHENLKRGQFNQFTRNRMLAGRVCGIFGFGGIGAAAARLMHGIGMRVHAINRRGRTDQRVDWIGTPERLKELLEAADVLLISAPLTRTTHSLIGAAELRRMKDDAILVNLARGEIVQERALYDHLVRHPNFTACIDAWWVEPVRHGEFRIDQPFLNLPNVIASPHNSAQGDGAHDISLRRAVENCRRALTSEAPLHLIGLDERLLQNSLQRWNIYHLMAAERDVLKLSTKKYGALTVSGNYAKVAEGLNVASMRVDKPAAIVPAIKNAVAVTETGAPFLLEFVVKEGYDFSRYS